MANCCNNLLVVTGPAEDRRRLARLWTDGGPVFDRILPQPDPFTNEDIARLRADLNDLYAGGEKLLDDVIGPTWWWRRFNWGTTSDVDAADDVQERGEETIIDFMTDGEPPVPVVEAMSRLYPSLTFQLKWFETGCRLAGEVRFIAGNGQARRYPPGSPDYERLAAEFGYEEEEEEEDPNEAS